MDDGTAKKRKRNPASLETVSLKKPREIPAVKSSSASHVDGEMISAPNKTPKHSRVTSKALKARSGSAGERKKKDASAASEQGRSKAAKHSLPTADSEAVADADEQAAEVENEDEDDGDHLHGFSSGSDSSDEDDDVDNAPPIDVAKLPTIAKDDETVRRRLEHAKRIKTDDRGVLFLGRIPHGFYEDQMRGYFSQFGPVTRLRMSRNKRTGASKHYAFIEFESAAVAEIVADTMNNYLLFGRILQCRVIPPNEVHPELWVGANRKWKQVPSQRVHRVKYNRERSEEEKASLNARLLHRQEEKKQKLLEAGIEYDLDAVGFKRRQQVTEA